MLLLSPLVIICSLPAAIWSTSGCHKVIANCTSALLNSCVIFISVKSFVNGATAVTRDRYCWYASIGGCLHELCIITDDKATIATLHDNRPYDRRRRFVAWSLRYCRSWSMRRNIIFISCRHCPKGRLIYGYLIFLSFSNFLPTGPTEHNKCRHNKNTAYERQWSKRRA